MKVKKGTQIKCIEHSNLHQRTTESKVQIYPCYYSNYLTKRVMSA